MNATFWPNSETTTAIQVHTIRDAKIVLAIGPQEVRRIAFAVRGKPLEVYEVRRTISWVRNWTRESLPDAKEVWGGDWSDSEALATHSAIQILKSPESFAPTDSQFCKCVFPRKLQGS